MTVTLHYSHPLLSICDVISENIVVDLIVTFDLLLGQNVEKYTAIKQR